MSDKDRKDEYSQKIEKLEIGAEVTGRSSKWTIMKKLGEGAFGSVYVVQKSEDRRIQGAMKVEKKAIDDPTIKLEFTVLHSMKDEKVGIKGMDYGEFDDSHFLIMSLCGKDLQYILDNHSSSLSVQTVSRIGIHCLHSIKILHDHGYIHRDIKPANFVVELEGSRILMIDFGMARCYGRKLYGNWMLRRERESAPFRGNMKYASIRAHSRLELSRSDEVYSWLLMVVDMLCPLPWSSLINEDAIEYQKKEKFENFIKENQKSAWLSPILSSLQGTSYESRPDYTLYFDVLMNKLICLNGTVAGRWEFQNLLSGSVDGQDPELNGDRKSESTGNIEIEMRKELAASFRTVVIPGGAEHLLAEGADFFDDMHKKELKDDGRRKKSNSRSKSKSTTKSVNIRLKKQGKAEGPGKKF